MRASSFMNAQTANRLLNPNKAIVVCIVHMEALSAHLFRKVENAVVVDNQKQNNMRKTLIGLMVGFVAGLIDIIPMIIQNLTWDANLSALTMWIVVGFITSRIEIKVNPIFKGILIAFLVLLPCAILISWKEPISLIPISIMTTILGGLQGLLIYKLLNKKTK